MRGWGPAGSGQGESRGRGGGGGGREEPAGWQLDESEGQSAMGQELEEVGKEVRRRR